MDKKFLDSTGVNTLCDTIVDTLNRLNTRTNTKIEGLKTDQIASLERRATTTEGKVATLERSSATHALTADLNNAVDRIANIEGAVDELKRNSDLHAAASDLRSTNTRVSGLETTVAILQNNEPNYATKVSLSSVDTQVQANAADITYLKTRDTDMASAATLSTLQSTVNEQIGKLTTVAGLCETHAKQADLAKLEQSVQSLAGTVQTINNAAKDHVTKTQFNTLESKVRTNATDIAFKASQSTVDNLTGRVSSLESADTATSASLTDAKGKISDLEVTFSEHAKAYASHLNAEQLQVDACLTNAKTYTDNQIKKVLIGDENGDGLGGSVNLSTAYDTLKEVAAWIGTHGTEAGQVFEDVKTNATAIEAEKTRAKNAEGVLSADISNIKGNADTTRINLGTLATDVANISNTIKGSASVENSALNTLQKAKTYTNDEVSKLIVKYGENESNGLLKGVVDVAKSYTNQEVSSLRTTILGEDSRGGKIQEVKTDIANVKNVVDQINGTELEAGSFKHYTKQQADVAASARESMTSEYRKRIEAITNALGYPMNNTANGYQTVSGSEGTVKVKLDDYNSRINKNKELIDALDVIVTRLNDNELVSGSLAYTEKNLKSKISSGDTTVKTHAENMVDRIIECLGYGYSNRDEHMCSTANVSVKSAIDTANANHTALSSKHNDLKDSYDTYVTTTNSAISIIESRLNTLAKQVSELETKLNSLTSK